MWDIPSPQLTRGRQMKKITILIELIVKIVLKRFDGSKKEFIKFVVQTLITILTAILTALSTISCV